MNISAPSFQTDYQTRLDTLRGAVAPRIVPLRARWASLRPDASTLQRRLKTLHDRDAAVFSPEAQKVATKALCAYSLQPTDVFITTAPRSGTTLTQQIVHQLRTGGDMRFTSIDEVVPWLDLHLFLNLPLCTEQMALHTPRAYKTHLRFDQLPPARPNAKGAMEPPARCICVVRSPLDMLLSMFEFRQYAPEELVLEEMVRDWLYGQSVPIWFQPLLSFHLAMQQFPGHVLCIFYEDLITHRAEAIRRIGHFLGLETTPDFNHRVEVATALSSIDFMRAHVQQFEDPAIYGAIAAALKRTPPDRAIVSTGQVGRGRLHCPEAARREHEEVMALWLEAAFGVRDYAQLQALFYADDSLPVFKPGMAL